MERVRAGPPRIDGQRWCGQLVELFFFSSRRRHTRFKCDWSSDVCSSDLLGRRMLLAQMGVLTAIWTALLVAAIYMAHFHNELLVSKPVYELVMAVAEDLADLPDRQQHSLAALDTALRHEYGDRHDDIRFTPTQIGRAHV